MLVAVIGIFQLLHSLAPVLALEQIPLAPAFVGPAAGGLVNASLAYVSRTLYEYDEI